ncbi:mandelate racemase/muconate lactonizing enzyme family protein [Nesterenkonia haasae]|uniref:mandelate racemase/muconate lactonizing enzyme family protein n=1 Tax=Nesterenkonia haasae TaxID=2587813 RepID=UPI0013910793|nr:mandelate racemase/muconate lactonizing enzyme family protein [Nesterenkonia haasae]NDK31113.1 mandelate racemase/muconate lactonizing enzyme family protein [Nesterenkonia haasae]
MKIDQIEFQLSRIRLPKGDWGDQIHHVTHIEIITADVYSDTGIVGTGFTHTSGVGGRTILAMLEEMRPTLIGQSVNPRSVWHDAWRYIRDNGPGGVTTLALAAIDIALWDIVGKVQNKALADVIGRVREDVPLYGSGINLNLSADEVVEQVRDWRGRGYFAGKVKVGKPELEEDVYRLTKIREAVGEYPLMVDANQGWSYPEAVRAMERFRHLNLYWVEEPLPVDDVLGHARLRARSSLPIGLGENVYTLNQFNQFLASDACDFVQADIGRVGGITPYLDIAAVARSYNVPMAPHFVMELSAHLLCAVPNALGAEDTHGGTLTELGVIEPQHPVNGVFTPPLTAGHGLVFDRVKLSANAVNPHETPVVDTLAADTFA